jgi:hypothetical protein
MDFNGTSKVQAKGTVAYRGAYAGEGINPGWLLQAGVKGPSLPSPKRAATVVWLSPPSGPAGSTVQLRLTGADFTPESTLAVDGSGVEVSNVKVESATRITATLKIAAGASAGVRGITVGTPNGNSNAANFRITARRPAKG